MNPEELRVYQAIRGGGSRAAVAELTEDGACGNCFGMVPLQHQNEVRHGESLIRCEACGVILAAPEPVDEAAVAAAAEAKAAAEAAAASEADVAGADGADGDGKVMAFVQRRKGPDVVGSFGLLQPLADGLKLILKEPISPSSANFSLFRMAPVATFMLSLVAWAVVPFDYGMVLSDPNIGLLYLFAISSLGVYGIIIAGWSSKTGGGRSVAYDIRTNWSKMGLCRRC
jgi:NADH-ubiquinone oxidoreductase chain 1